MFLPSLSSWSVGSPGSLRLGMPLRSGVLFPGLSLFCIGSASFLASSPAPSVSYGLVVVFPLGGLLLYGCIGSLLQRWSAVVLSSVVCLQSSFPTFVVVLFLPPSSFRPPSVSVGCVPSAFAMGSPWPGSSIGVVFLHSIGTKA